MGQNGFAGLLSRTTSSVRFFIVRRDFMLATAFYRPELNIKR
jgi:hypothetical protein